MHMSMKKGDRNLQMPDNALRTVYQGTYQANLCRPSMVGYKRVLHADVVDYRHSYADLLRNFVQQHFHAIFQHC